MAPLTRRVTCELGACAACAASVALDWAPISADHFLPPPYISPSPPLQLLRTSNSHLSPGSLGAPHTLTSQAPFTPEASRLGIVVTTGVCVARDASRVARGVTKTHRNTTPAQQLFFPFRSGASGAECGSFHVVKTRNQKLEPPPGDILDPPSDPAPKQNSSCAPEA